MTLYLSRLLLDPHGRDVRRDLADCHALHARVMAAFPKLAEADGDARERLGVLYRLDASPRGECIQLLVQSLAAPDWSRLDRGYLLATPGTLRNPDCKPLDGALDALRDGMDLRFRLRANPTRRVNASKRGSDPLAGKRVELQTEAEWDAWLARKGEAAGFSLLDVRSQADSGLLDQMAAVYGAARPAREPVPDVRAAGGLKVTGRKAGRRVTFGAVLFEGRLRVTDADRLRAAIASGIGTGKAYGFGLLSVAR